MDLGLQRRTTRRSVVRSAMVGAAAVAGSVAGGTAATATPARLTAPAVTSSMQSGPTLTFWSFLPSARFPGRAELFAEWESRTGARIQIEEVESGNALTQKLTAAYTAGLMPDLIDPSASELLIDYAAQGFLLPVDDVLARLGQDDFVSISRQFGTYDGQLFGVPVFAFPHVMHYRRDWFEAEGIATPTTWSELIAAAEAFHGRVENDAEVAGLAAYLVSIQAPIYFQNQVGPNNGYTFDPDNNVAINSPEVREAMAHFQDSSRFFQPGFASHRIAETRGLFLEGKIAIECDSTSMAQVLVQSESEIASNVGTALLPWGPSSQRDRGGFNGIAYLAVGSQTKEPDLAKDFVEWFNSPEVLIRAFQAFDWGFIPQRRTVAESPDWLAVVPELARPIIEVGTQAAAISTFPGQDHGPNPLANRIRSEDIYRNLLLRLADGDDVDESVTWAEREILRVVEEG